MAIMQFFLWLANHKQSCYNSECFSKVGGILAWPGPWPVATIAKWR